MKIHKSVFIDTSGFYAMLAADDDKHESARDIIKTARTRNILFCTTDYILDETATLLLARKKNNLTNILFDTVFNSAVCSIHWMNAEYFEQTVPLFHKYSDQHCSFTDCFSFLVMRQCKIQQALTKDRHFECVGFQKLL